MEKWIRVIGKAYCSGVQIHTVDVAGRIQVTLIDNDPIFGNYVQEGDMICLLETPNSCKECGSRPLYDKIIIPPLTYEECLNAPALDV